MSPWCIYLYFNALEAFYMISLHTSLSKCDVRNLVDIYGRVEKLRKFFSTFHNLSFKDFSEHNKFTIKIILL